MKKIPLLSCLFMMIFFAHCRKTDNNNTIVTTGTFKTYSSLNEVFSLLKVQPKYVTINAATGGSFYGNSGTRYIFPPNCFQDAAGNSITGNVQIEVAEYLKKGDMVFSKKLPMSYGEPLVSAGEAYVKGTSGGVQVFIKPGMKYQVNIPQFGTPEPGMQFFSGVPSDDTFATTVNWRRRFDSLSVIYKGDTVCLFPDSMYFDINGDKYRYYNDPQLINVKITLNNAALTSSDDIRSYVFIDNEKSLTYISQVTSPSPGVYNGLYYDKIPVHFVSFGVINNRFYGGVLGATPSTGTTYTLNLTEVKPEDFKGQINNLTK